MDTSATGLQITPLESKDNEKMELTTPNEETLGTDVGAPGLQDTPHHKAELCY
jgi:hypothetical protein